MSSEAAIHKGSAMLHPTDSPVTLTLNELIDLRAEPKDSSDLHVSNSPWAGRFRGLRRGQGMDFDDLRPYVPGDDVRHIDWKVSARLGVTHSRLYREEKERAVTVLLDFRDSMFTGSQELRSVVAGRTAAIQLWQAANIGSRVAVVIVEQDDIKVSQRAIGERGALLACALIARCFANRRNALIKEHSDSGARPSSPGVSLDDIADHCETEGRRLGKLIFITGLDDVQLSDTATPARALHRMHMRAASTLMHVTDALEQNPLPNGQYHFRANHAPDLQREARLARIDRKARKSLESHLQTRQEAVAQICLETGIDLKRVGLAKKTLR